MQWISRRRLPRLRNPEAIENGNCLLALAVLVLIDVPGLGPEQLDLSLAGNMLTIQGAFPASAAADADHVHLRERPAGAFKRCVPLPASVAPGLDVFGQAWLLDSAGPQGLLATNALQCRTR